MQRVLRPLQLGFLLGLVGPCFGRVPFLWRFDLVSSCMSEIDGQIINEGVLPSKLKGEWALSCKEVSFLSSSPSWEATSCRACRQAVLPDLSGFMRHVAAQSLNNLLGRLLVWGQAPTNFRMSKILQRQQGHPAT